MEEEILKEILEEYGVKDENLIKVLINICIYYKITNTKEIIKIIKSAKIFDNTLTTNSIE